MSFSFSTCSWLSWQVDRSKLCSFLAECSAPVQWWCSATTRSWVSLFHLSYCCNSKYKTWNDNKTVSMTLEVSADHTSRIDELTRLCTFLLFELDSFSRPIHFIWLFITAFFCWTATSNSINLSFHLPPLLNRWYHCAYRQSDTMWRRLSISESVTGCQKQSWTWMVLWGCDGMHGTRQQQILSPSYHLAWQKAGLFHELK